MPIVIPSLKRGPKWLRNWSELIAGEVVARTPLPGFNTTIQQGADGRAINAVSSADPANAHPFKAMQISPPEGRTGEGWIKIWDHSMLAKNLDPTSNIEIGGLGDAGAFQVTAAGQRAWVEIDLSPTFDDGDADPAASIQHGTRWSVGKANYPFPVEYDTDNGKFGGHDPSHPPAHMKQTKIMIPIFYTVAKTADDFAPIGEKAGIEIVSGVFLVQQLRNHLLLMTTCFDGDAGCKYAMPWHATQP